MVTLSIRVREPKLSSKITRLIRSSVKKAPTKVDSKPKLAGMRVSLSTAKPMVKVLSCIPLVNLRVTSTSVR